MFLNWQKSLGNSLNTINIKFLICITTVPEINGSKSEEIWLQILKNALESLEIDGIRQNWRVNLMSEGQGTIYQQQEYVVVNQMLSGSNPRLPRILD